MKLLYRMLIRSNKMRQCAGIYLLQIYFTCFWCPSHPSSGVHKTVTAASGTGHSIWATTFLQRGLFIYCKITLHVSGVHRTHRQEYIKLCLQLLVQVIVSGQQPSPNVAYLFTANILYMFRVSIALIIRSK